MTKIKKRGILPTPREEDILHLVAQCDTYHAIHQKLGVSIRTVENQVYRFMKKIDLHKKEHLIKYAQEHGYGRKGQA